MDLHPDVQALARALRELEAHLRAVERSDAWGVGRFLELSRGGMGTMSDIIVLDDPGAYGQFRFLLGRASGLAYELRTEVE